MINPRLLPSCDLQPSLLPAVGAYIFTPLLVSNMTAGSVKAQTVISSPVASTSYKQQFLSRVVGAGLEDALSLRQTISQQNPPYDGKQGEMQRDLKRAIAPSTYTNDAAVDITAKQESGFVGAGCGTHIASPSADRPTLTSGKSSGVGEWVRVALLAAACPQGVALPKRQEVQDLAPAGKQTTFPHNPPSSEEQRSRGGDGVPALGAGERIEPNSPLPLSSSAPQPPGTQDISLSHVQPSLIPPTELKKGGFVPPFLREGRGQYYSVNLSPSPSPTRRGKFCSPLPLLLRGDERVRSALSEEYCLNSPVLAQLPGLNPSRPTVPTPPPQDIRPPTPSPTPVAPPTLPQVPPLGTPMQPPIAPSTPEEVPSTDSDTITVERFEVVGSTVFSKKELNEVLKKFTGHPITFAEVLQARSAVTQLYFERGYVTSGAYIPENQDLKAEGAVVTIKVIEGQLEEIQVVGTRRLRPNYIRSRIALAAKKPLNRKRLLEALQLLRLNPLIQDVTAELSSGSRPGQSLLKVQVTEAKTFGAQLLLDNSRSPSVGSFQRGVQLFQANLTGRGDGLSLAYSNTDGSNGGELSYTLPINPRNGTLSFAFSDISSNVIERPFNILDINANYRSYELTLRQPLVQTPTQEFALGVTAARRETKSTFIEELQAPFPYPGSDEQGRTRISELRFFQEYTKRSSRFVIAARSQFIFGLGILGATINPSPPDGRFVLWQGQAQYVRLLGSETLLLLRANVQLADRALPPLEQFGLGGVQSVRGYRQDALLGDSGAFASAEVRLPIYRTSNRQTILQLIPFADVGTVFNSSGFATPKPSNLVSVGLGLQLQLVPRLTVRLDYGIPLVDVGFKGRTWQEHGVYFSVQYNPF